MRESLKQSTSNNCTFFSEVEIEVSAILLDLPNLISESERHHGFSLISWVGRRRSALDKTRPSKQRRPEANNKIEYASPTTPLCFSPSESDDKSEHSLKRNSKKRKREELLEIIDGLTQSNDLLRGEIETLRSNYKKQYALNLEMKAKEQKRNGCLKTEDSHLGMNRRSSNLGIKLDQITIFAPQQQQVIVDQTSLCESQVSGRFQDPCGQWTPFLSSHSGLGTVDQKGPSGIPDLNLSAEENSEVNSPQPLDLSRVPIDNRFMAAEARRRRKLKIAEKKNYFAAIRLSRCR